MGSETELPGSTQLTERSEQSEHWSFESQKRYEGDWSFHLLSWQNCYHYQQTHGDSGTKRVHLRADCYNNCSFNFRFLTIAVVLSHLLHPLPRNPQWWRSLVTLVMHPQAAPSFPEERAIEGIWSLQAERTQLHVSLPPALNGGVGSTDEQPPCSLLDCPSPWKHSPPCSSEKQLPSLLSCEPTGSGTLPDFCTDGGKISTLQCLQRWRGD